MSELNFTEAELKSIRKEFCDGSTDEQFLVFIENCKRRNLIPGVHVVFQLRTVKVWDSVARTESFVKKATWITTIQALRLIAQRTGEYAGQGRETFVYLDDSGAPTLTSHVPLPVHGSPALARIPWVAESSVKRKGFEEPMIGIARFNAYAQMKDGKPTSMWATRGPEQLAKCAEALALRKAFPEELGGLYLEEELQAEQFTPAEVIPAPKSPVTAPEAPQVPVVDQTPAVAKEVSSKPKDEPVESKKEPEAKLTEDDFDFNPGEKLPEPDAEEGKKTQDFIENLEPLPDVPCTEEQRKTNAKKFSAEVKRLKLDQSKVSARFLAITGKKKSADFSQVDWNICFNRLTDAERNGKLKEFLDGKEEVNG